MRASHARPRRQSGITLVEVLVTLVSTSVGLLGIAALQIVSLRSNQDALVRLEASALASSMLERMRVNKPGLDRGDYDHVRFNATKSASGRASEDLMEWQREIDRSLPGGSEVAAGSIERSTTNNIIVVTIRWSAHKELPSSLQMRSEI